MYNWWEPIQDLVTAVLEVNKEITAKTFIHKNLYCAKFEWLGNTSRLFWFPIDECKLYEIDNYNERIRNQAFLAIKDLLIM